MLRLSGMLSFEGNAKLRRKDDLSPFRIHSYSGNERFCGREVYGGICSRYMEVYAAGIWRYMQRGQLIISMPGLGFPCSTRSSSWSRVGQLPTGQTSRAYSSIFAHARCDNSTQHVCSGHRPSVGFLSFTVSV